MTTAQLAGSVAFLRANLARIVEDPTFPVEDFAREIRECRRTLARHDDDRPDNSGIRIPCPSDHPDADGRDCGWRLVLRIGEPASVIVCPQCQEHWTSARLLIVGLSDPEVTIWAYPDVIEDTLGIPGRTLRHWASVGAVARLGSRYDVGAAYRLRHYSAG